MALDCGYIFAGVEELIWLKEGYIQWGAKLLWKGMWGYHKLYPGATLDERFGWKCDDVAGMKG